MNQNKWNKENLISMLLDQDYLSPIIKNEATGVCVQRVTRIDENMQKNITIKKLYPRKLSYRQLNESLVLFNAQFYPEITRHVGKLVSFNDSTKFGKDIRTRWCGFDISAWIEILEEKTPFLSSISSTLGLIRGVLEATEKFHSEGFVHNDLHSKNIILNFDFDVSNGLGFIKTSDVKLIDFEYSFLPIESKNGLPRRGNSCWIKESNEENECNNSDLMGNMRFEEVIANYKKYTEANLDSMLSCYDILHPENHSEYVIPFEIETVVDDRNILIRQLKHDDQGRRILKSNFFSEFMNVDFGVDFFTFSKVVENLIRRAKLYKCWNENDVNHEVLYNYISGLPGRLREYDTQPSASRRTIPHRFFINEINSLIGVDAYRNLPFKINLNQENSTLGTVQADGGFELGMKIVAGKNDGSNSEIKKNMWAIFEKNGILKNIFESRCAFLSQLIDYFPDSEGDINKKETTRPFGLSNDGFLNMYVLFLFFTLFGLMFFYIARIDVENRDVNDIIFNLYMLPMIFVSAIFIFAAMYTIVHIVPNKNISIKIQNWAYEKSNNNLGVSFFLLMGLLFVFIDFDFVAMVFYFLSSIFFFLSYYPTLENLLIAHKFHMATAKIRLKHRWKGGGALIFMDILLFSLFLTFSISHFVLVILAVKLFL